MHQRPARPARVVPVLFCQVALRFETREGSGAAMDAWLRSAVGYIADWLELQLEGSQQPGVIIAITQRGDLVSERAFGLADLDSGEKLTPRHRFRIASH